MLRMIPQRRAIARGIRYYSLNSKKAAPAAPETGSLDESIRKAIPKLIEAKAFIDLIQGHGKKLDKMTLVEREKRAAEVYELGKAIVGKLHELKPSEKDQNAILNELIKKFAKVNWGVALLALKELEANKKKAAAVAEHHAGGKGLAAAAKPLLEAAAVAELLKHNPGKDKTAAEIYDKHVKGHKYEGDLLKLILLEKLVHGDKSEKHFGKALTSIDLPKAVKIFETLGEIVDKSATNPDTLTKIAEDLINLGLGKVLPGLEIPAPIVNKIIEKKTHKKEPLSHEDVFHLLNSAKKHEGGLQKLPSDLLLKSFLAIAALQAERHKSTENYDKFEKLIKEHYKQFPEKKAKKHGIELTGPKELAEEVAQEIVNRKLDKNAKVMLDLVRSAGFYSGDVKKAIDLYEKYESRIPKNHPAHKKLNTLMSVALIYHAIKTGEKKYDHLAHMIAPQKPKPAPESVASFILEHGWFGDQEKAVKTYSDAIKLFLDPKNDKENVKARSQLIKSLVLTTLLGDDSALAKLILRKSSENGLTDKKTENKIEHLIKVHAEKKAKHIKEKEHKKKMHHEMKKLFLLALVELAPRIEQSLAESGVTTDDLLNAAESGIEAVKEGAETIKSQFEAEAGDFVRAAAKAAQAAQAEAKAELDAAEAEAAEAEAEQRGKGRY